MTQPPDPQKLVIYQVFTRLFGNKNSHLVPWGTIDENGVGKFNDFTDKALHEIRALGVSHIWFTGVLHHAVITDYSQVGIANDDPNIVKGRAGSPYAVKDYYNVNPDLATNPANRLSEFEALVQRTHNSGMKVIIDIVPNHVARNYKGITNPPGVSDFGASDNTNIEYDRNNDFYYVPGEKFELPQWLHHYQPLGGLEPVVPFEKFEEYPAKWTGNGSRAAQPHFYDWYETAKINYGVQPSGLCDFDALPDEYRHKTYDEHYTFWSTRNVPSAWIKFASIALYWLDKGVDGFRYDMAELVPVEFWSYLNATIKTKNAHALLLAEVYQPHLYRDFIFKGKMDYLYDKVGLYDTLKNIIKGYGSTDTITEIENGLADIEHHMIRFLENHDEQRIASPDFAGNADKGKPMMVLSATLSTAPTMLYFAQELGEPAADSAGFGSASRTTIFDYWAVPSLQRWMNNGAFDGGQSTANELALRDFYKRLLHITLRSSALVGNYAEIHSHNRQHTEWYNDKVYAFVRWSNTEKLLIVCNFDANNSFGFELQIPQPIVDAWHLNQGSYRLTDQLYGIAECLMHVQHQTASTRIDIKPLESFIFQLHE